ncbi:MAG: Xaa-Pro peptidase family protein [Muribaculaceae bacterium]|nr:Xaa-Pro peptidase family protein [Muribaculaceae bacterium]
MEKTVPLILPELREEVELRMARLLPLMRDAGMEAMLIASNANIYYAAGRFYRGYVYVTSGGRVIYFVIRPDIFTRADSVVKIRKPELIPGELGKLGLQPPSTIGLEMDTLAYSDIMRLGQVFPDARPLNASGLLRQARQVKTPFEIRLMKEDGLHQAAVYHKITRLYKRDMTDVEFQIEIERALRMEGNLGYFRVAGNLMEINMGSVISGDNADAPSPYEFAMGGGGADPALPGGASGEIMKVGQTVMVDVNGCFNGYQTDMTRVWRIGEVSPLAYKTHECSRRILHVLEKEARPGMEVCELYRRAEAIVAEEGLEAWFMGHRQQAGFIGHGVGIELNETPAITPRCHDLLREDMTLAIEPKFVVPGVGATGIENTYFVRPDGLECITPFPEEMQDLL